jgi:hypothetical protein
MAGTLIPKKPGLGVGVHRHAFSLARLIIKWHITDLNLLLMRCSPVLQSSGTKIVISWVLLVTDQFAPVQVWTCYTMDMLHGMTALGPSCWSPTHGHDTTWLLCSQRSVKLPVGRAQDLVSVLSSTIVTVDASSYSWYPQGLWVFLLQEFASWDTELWGN